MAYKGDIMIATVIGILEQVHTLTYMGCKISYKNYLKISQILLIL
jgi:hypothetical protein